MYGMDLLYGVIGLGDAVLLTYLVSVSGSLVLCGLFWSEDTRIVQTSLHVTCVSFTVFCFSRISVLYCCFDG